MPGMEPMTVFSKPLIALSLVTVLAACGGGAPDETGQTDATMADQVELPEIPVPREPGEQDTTLTDDDAAVESAETSAPPTAETATPVPAATPAAPAAEATPAAAPATPPQAYIQCSVCHAVAPGEHGLGPSLAGVFNAEAGHVEGFTYSQAMLDSGLVWDEASLHAYLENPRGVVPGTTMAFAGVRDDARRQAIIDYLKTL